MPAVYVNGIKTSVIIQQDTQYIVTDRINDILTGPDATKVTYSSTSADGAPWKAFDGVKTGTESSCWIPTYGSTNCWICYHFTSPKIITKCHVYFYQNMSGTYTGSIKFQGSVDGTTWVDISAPLSLSVTRGTFDYEIESTDTANSYSYVRMYSEDALVVYGNPSLCTLEIEIYGTNHSDGRTKSPSKLTVTDNPTSTYIEFWSDPRFEITFNESGAWSVKDLFTYDGHNMYSPPIIGNNGRTEVYIKNTSSNTIMIKVAYKSSTEGPAYDYGLIYVDDRQVGSNFGGSMEGITDNFVIPSDSTVTLVYRKDGGTTGGLDSIGCLFYETEVE